MNREAIQKLYAHIDFVWPQIVQIVSDGGPDVLTKAAPGSGWPNLRNCLAHLLYAYERWLTVLTGEEQGNASEKLQTLGEIDAARAGFRRRIDTLLDGLSDEELQAMRTFVIDEDKMPYSYAELLTHVALHERGHHGDVTTLFWQLGIDADREFDYRFHLGRTPLD